MGGGRGMTEDTAIKLALTVGLLNYMDNETPRHYFIDGNAGLEEVIEFAELIVRECTDILSTYRVRFDDGFEYNCAHPVIAINKHFGIK
jgi:hypothetical protein